jgi:hypothetical protein
MEPTVRRSNSVNSSRLSRRWRRPPDQGSQAGDEGVLDDSGSRCLTFLLSRLEYPAPHAEPNAAAGRSGTFEMRPLRSFPRIFNSPLTPFVPARGSSSFAAVRAAVEVMWRAHDGTPEPEDSRGRGMGDWKWHGPMARQVRPCKKRHVRGRGVERRKPGRTPKARPMGTNPGPARSPGGFARARCPRVTAGRPTEAEPWESRG